MMKNYNWATLGCGVIANELAQAMAAHGRTLYGVANRTHSKAVDFAKKYGDLGLVYGSQLRKWKTSQGDTIDQIANVIQQIKTTPD